MAHFCLLLFMGNHFLLRQQLVIVIVAKIRLLRNSEVHVSELKLREVLWSRSLRTPYLAKFDDPIFLQPPNVVDGIFNVSLRSQKVCGCTKSFALEMASCCQITSLSNKIRVVRTGPYRHFRPITGG